MLYKTPFIILRVSVCSLKLLPNHNTVCSLCHYGCTESSRALTQPCAFPYRVTHSLSASDQFTRSLHRVFTMHSRAFLHFFPRVLDVCHTSPYICSDTSIILCLCQNKYSYNINLLFSFESGLKTLSKKGDQTRTVNSSSTDDSKWKMHLCEDKAQQIKNLIFLLWLRTNRHQL